MVGSFYVYKNKLTADIARQKNGSYLASTDTQIRASKPNELERKHLAQGEGNCEMVRKLRDIALVSNLEGEVFCVVLPEQRAPARCPVGQIVGRAAEVRDDKRLKYRPLLLRPAETTRKGRM